MVPHDRVRHLDLPGRIFLAIAVAVVHENLGNLGREKQANRALEDGCMTSTSFRITTELRRTNRTHMDGICFALRIFQTKQCRSSSLAHS
jgi:hypothetical protein